MILTFRRVTWTKTIVQSSYRNGQKRRILRRVLRGRNVLIPIRYLERFCTKHAIWRRCLKIIRREQSTDRGVHLVIGQRILYLGQRRGPTRKIWAGFESI